MTEAPPLLLMAAGFGTRMGALTRDRPKPLINHALGLARGVGASPIAANLHYKAQMLADHLEPLGVKVSVETPDILDTGGGVKAALPLLGDPDVCVTLNTDAIWAGPNPLGQLLAEWDPKRMDALLACVPLSATVGRTKGGDFTVREDGRIGWGGDMVYGGAQLIRTGLFAGDPRSVFSMADVWNAMVANRRLFGAVYPGRWCDVGHPEGIALAEGLLAGSHV